MVRVNLKGIAKVTAKGRTYWYAWRGGPRLRGEPGSPSSSLPTVRPRERASAGHSTLPVTRHGSTRRATTTRSWPTRPSAIGRRGSTASATTLAIFASRSSIGRRRSRPVIRHWRNQWADKPRTADYGLQVLVPRALLRRGPARQDRRQSLRGHQAALQQRPLGDHLDGRRYRAAQDRRAAAARSPCAVDLAAHTGLRLGDLLRLSWSHVGEDAIAITTGKSKHRREAIIPLYDALQRLCWRASRSASTTILTNSRRAAVDSRTDLAPRSTGRRSTPAWPSAICISTTSAARRRRGSTSPACRSASSPKSWRGRRSTSRKIIRRYVGRSAATKAAIDKLNRPRKVNIICKTDCKTGSANFG